VEEPQPQYQTNEITRSLALKVQGVPVMLYAPAMPTPDLFEVLVRDHQVMRVQSFWGTARAALLGVGAPPQGRWSLPSVISAQAAAMQSAIGDICARPYDRNGRPIDFPGAERLIAITLEDLRRVPHTIAVAVGQEKVESILVAARAGYLNTLVTDRATALALVEAVASAGVSVDDAEAAGPGDLLGGGEADLKEAHGLQLASARQRPDVDRLQPGSGDHPGEQ
jgi:DNA-binding transcriptional regulator LsrR (DeoR family)